MQQGGMFWRMNVAGWDCLVDLQVQVLALSPRLKYKG